MVGPAACGTGPYVGQVLGAGRQVVGTDQSSGMLGQARSKYPKARFELVGLQERALEGEFDAVMCIDAMEHVPPEDWPPRRPQPLGWTVASSSGCWRDR
jgi:2-polyprenyl-3-methyl-5-hydroxy-6-metoxy-1,4-benzoquinol methylase